MDKTNVAKLRKEKGWTQEELAEKSYLTVRTIQRMEAGSDVSLSTLSSVAQGLSVSLSDLFEQIEEDSKEIQIMEMSQDQVRQRRAEKNAVLLLVVAVDFVLLSLLGIGVHHLPESQQATAGTLWDGALFLAIALSIYVVRILHANYLDKKYPLSVGYKEERHYEPVQNGWDFLGRYWWIVFPIGGFLFGLWSAMH